MFIFSSKHVEFIWLKEDQMNNENGFCSQPSHPIFSIACRTRKRAMRSRFEAVWEMFLIKFLELIYIDSLISFFLWLCDYNYNYTYILTFMIIFFCLSAIHNTYRFCIATSTTTLHARRFGRCQIKYLSNIL